MRYIWLGFFLLAAFIIGITLRDSPREATRSISLNDEELAPPQVRPVVYAVETKKKSREWHSAPPPAPNAARADSLILFAQELLGTNYCYAGATPQTGFDCSGFVHYVFKRFGVNVPHSTALLISTGKEVARSSAQPGDIVVFTGTAATSTTPGHAGIVLSKPGEPLRFIHSSSARRESGVKISTVENSDYERRFMSVRRVL